MTAFKKHGFENRCLFQVWRSSNFEKIFGNKKETNKKEETDGSAERKEGKQSPLVWQRPSTIYKKTVAVVASRTHSFIHSFAVFRRQLSLGMKTHHWEQVAVGAFFSFHGITRRPLSYMKLVTRHNATRWIYVRGSSFVPRYESATHHFPPTTSKLALF